ncbi:flavin monoamine oxidase family protein [Chitinophaga pinensis]|uniref:Tryptophan 2-monooxygenase n=1 Tax=Chitinophaga pinensis TaxID=79329 RepID=A0A5C6LTF1_9BACT|nr:NAD(P)/FAD-dependent oxidoreductase [Chitinophaga pinensis]TWV99827.1 FAD-dependent oxidoreductase [Chitinophaga pinensis]
MRTSEEIIIIGAGAAGLIAARELSAHHTVTVLEARETTGGRIQTVYKDGVKSAETGAEFVHGELPITLGLLKEAGLSYYNIYGKMFQVRDGKWDARYEMIEDWDGLLEKMSAIPTDTTMQAFLNEHYPGEQYASLHESVQSFVQGYDLADMTKVSVKALYREWTNESEKNFRIDRGYSAMIHFLEDVCRRQQARIITNAVVSHIEWSAGMVKVTTKAGTTYTGTKVIIAVPLGILQQGAIHFSPALPAHTTAVHQIGWGTVIKTVLAFKEPFWEKHAEQMGFLLGKAPIPTWWTQLPDKANVLTGWLGGPPAIPHLHKTNEALLEMALQSLAILCNESIDMLKAQLVESHISNWATDPHISGSYSYSTPATTAAQVVLNTPVDGTIYFAGEALYNGASPGTVEAALSTGKAVAERILKRASQK